MPLAPKMEAAIELARNGEYISTTGYTARISKPLHAVVLALIEDARFWREAVKNADICRWIGDSCVWCGASRVGCGEIIDEAKHKPDCPWIRAQE